jgi:3-dehydroquinate dehydratase II
MKTVLLIHGPNLNLLGRREAKIYGAKTLSQLQNLVKVRARGFKMSIKAFQSNHEGALIDFLQKQSPKASGVIINPGALTHYSYALHDALIDANIPCIEVHLSDIKSREKWRKKSVTAAACIKTIWGKKERGYLEALQILNDAINEKR